MRSSISGACSGAGNPWELEKMGVVSCADNSWRRRRPRSTGGQYYTFARVVGRQEGSRSRKSAAGEECRLYKAWNFI